MTRQITQVPDLEDNYFYGVRCENHGELAVFDPATPDQALCLCDRSKPAGITIFLTHHHFDHVGGVSAITETYPGTKVFASPVDQRRVAGVTHQAVPGASVPWCCTAFQVIDLKGHTLGHVGYYHIEDRALFSGDTLFHHGCGRLFEGSAAEMHESLGRIKSLPADTLIYCSHEYTIDNLEFCIQLQPDANILQDIREQAIEDRRQGLATVPFLLGPQLASNPFLTDSLEAFTKARALKDRYPDL